jgi:hypothetical protein
MHLEAYLQRFVILRERTIDFGLQEIPHNEPIDGQASEMGKHVYYRHAMQPTQQCHYG